MALTKEEVIAYIKNLPLSELTQLIGELQEQLGVSLEERRFSPQVFMGAPLPDPTMGMPDFPEFEVYLLAIGPSKMHAAKELRALKGLSIAESKSIVDDLPKRVGEGLSRDDAERWVRQLEEGGAKAEFRVKI